MIPQPRDRLEAAGAVPHYVVSEETSMVPTVVIRHVSVGKNSIVVDDDLTS